MNSQSQLGDHITTQKGYAFKSKWYSDEGHPIVKVSDFTSDSIDISKLVLIPQEIAYEYRKYELKANDVIIQTVGSWPSNPASVVGKTIRVPNKANGALLNQNAVKIEPDETLDKGYLYYLLRDNLFKEFIVGTAQGAASQASITLDSIRAYKFNRPSMDDQRNIAEILLAYDNLIENNNRRIAILEEMAQSLYRDWFVKFCFPGHNQSSGQTIGSAENNPEGASSKDGASQNTKFVDSPLGKIPEGWKVKPIAEVIEIMGGGTPSKKIPEYWDEDEADINWYTPSNLTKSSSMFMEESSLKITELGLSKSSAKLFPPYSVMMTSRATIGVISINTTPACTNQGFIICVPNDRICTEYIYYWLDSNMQTIDNLASGATFKEVRRTLFKELPLLVPCEAVHEEFGKKVSPITKMIERLGKKNINLKKQRDYLLPKLISGSIKLEQ